ncbi:DUF2059 domain-containing protein [Thiofilum flexile]|uniref:DUF2059 domain-containing protein n=1 Tax=Thiofilum flexile TaxID=125627 RepID=UPI00036B49F6|nr:DUF2059 domain-containing protein [Thiofilum flexile]
MKFVKVIALSLLFSTHLAFAEPATDATIEELLTLTKSEKMITDIHEQVKSMMDQSMAKMTQGEEINPEEQKAIDNMISKMLAAMKEEVSWEKMKPLSIKLYKETFTEEELKGMVDFYKTPAGEAMANKMPTLMQNTMTATQDMMVGLQPKMAKIQQEFMQDMAKAKDAAAEAKPEAKTEEKAEGKAEEKAEEKK